MSNKKYLDSDGLLYLWTRLKSYFVRQENGKVLTSNDLTNTLKSHYDSAYTHSTSNHAPSNAEKNTIVGVQKNGTDLTIDFTTRKVNIVVPTNNNQLTNGAGYQTSAQVESAITAKGYATTEQVASAVADIDLSGYIKNNDLVSITNGEIDIIVTS